MFLSGETHEDEEFLYGKSAFKTFYVFLDYLVLGDVIKLGAYGVTGIDFLLAAIKTLDGILLTCTLFSMELDTISPTLFSIS